MSRKGLSDQLEGTHVQSLDQEENGKPLQYFCLGNSVDKAAWRVTVHGVAKSWTRLELNNEDAPYYSGTLLHTFYI